MRWVVLGSANPYKAAEVRPLLAAAQIEVVTVREIDPDWSVEETGETLEENAAIKARAAAVRTGWTAVADDTGLFVDALGGAPGVHSSRYAGPGATYADNVRKLLAALEGVVPERRAARFRTVAVVARPDGREATLDGVLEGRILEAPVGEGGFGYDPVFLVPETGGSLAELSLEEKNRLSHRALAFAAVGEFLARHREWLADGEKPLGLRGASR